MDQADALLISDDDFSQSDHSRRDSPSSDDFFTVPQENIESELFDDTEPGHRNIIQSHDRHDLQREDTQRRSTSSPLLMSGARERRLSETARRIGRSDALSLDVPTQDQQVQLVLCTMNALETISTQSTPFGSESDIRDANEHLLRLESIHDLSADTILQTGLGGFLERNSGSTFPYESRYCFRERLNAFFLKCNRTRAATGRSQDGDTRVDGDYISVSSSVEPTPNTSRSSHSPVAALVELSPLAEDSRSNYNKLWPGKGTATAHSSPDHGHTDESTPRFRTSSATMVTSPSHSRRSSPPRSQSHESPFSGSESPLGTAQDTTLSPPPETSLRFDPPVTPLRGAAAMHSSSPPPEFSSGITLALESSPALGSPSPQSSTVSSTPKLEASNTVAYIILKIKDLETELEQVTKLFKKEDNTVVHLSNAAIEIEMQIAAKNEARQPLLAARRKLQDQLDLINAEIKGHKADLTDKNEATMLQVEAKGKTQDLLNVLAAKRREQDKKLSVALEDESLEREIADPLLRAIAKNIRRSNEDQWEINTDTGSDADTGVNSDDAGLDELDGDGNDNDPALNQEVDIDDRRPVKSPLPEPDQNDLLHDLVEACSRVADKDGDDITLSDFAAMGQAFDNVSGSEHVKHDPGDKPAVKAEIKREATIKTEEEGLSAEDSKITAGVKVENGVKIENGDQKSGLPSTQLDLATLNLRNLTAEDLRNSIAAVHHHQSIITRAFAVMKTLPSSSSPSPSVGRQSPYVREALDRKRKRSEVQDEAIPDLESDQQGHAPKQTKRRSSSAGRDTAASHVERTVRSSPTIQNESDADSDNDDPWQASALIVTEQPRQEKRHLTVSDMEDNDDDDTEHSRSAKPAKSLSVSPTGESGRLRRISLTKLQARNGWNMPEPELGHGGAEGQGMGQGRVKVNDKHPSVEPDPPVDLDEDQEQGILVAQPQRLAKRSLASFFKRGSGGWE